jgi:hypothetical protein
MSEVRHPRLDRHGQHGHHPPPDVPHRPGETHTPDAVQYDRDLSIRGVVWTALWLALGTIAVLILMWWLFVGLDRLERAADPPPPPLREARARHLPPEPRLQSTPDRDMLELRAAEDRLIERPSWIDQKQGTVRLPIDLAIDVLARRGLPATQGNPARIPGSLTVPAPAAPTPVTTAPAPPSPPSPTAKPTGGAR